MTSLSATTARVTVAGPGRVEFEAGRNIDLGNVLQGIQTIGNLRNPALPPDGASIVLAAGMTDVHYSDFAQTYLNPAAFGGLYNGVLIRYMKQFGWTDLNPELAWSEFQKLGLDNQTPLIRQGNRMWT